MSGLRPRHSCKDKFIELQILTVPSLYIFIETVSYVEDNNLIQAHQHSHFTRNHSVNPSVQHRLKLFESKPRYAGLKLFFQVTLSHQEY
jgi:predicted transcriptional regulator